MLPKNAAACCHGILGPVKPKVLKLLKDTQSVQKLDSGQLTLVHSNVEIGLSCHSPTLEMNTRVARATLELERELVAKGWTMVNTNKQASIKEMRAVKNNHTAYYSLLSHFCSTLEVLEEEGWLHHKQSQAYFLAVEQSIIQAGDQELLYLPPYQKVPFYQELIKYITGSLTKLTIASVLVCSSKQAKVQDTPTMYLSHEIQVKVRKIQG